MPPLLSAVLRSMHKQTPDVKNFFFELIEQKERPKDAHTPSSTMNFKPGQHIMIQFEKEGRKLFRPYSMTSLPEDLPKFELCIKRYPEGSASVYMHSLKAGDILHFLPPRGNLYVQRFDRDIAFLATGTGITPMMAMIRQVLEMRIRHKVWLFFGNRTEEDIIYKKEFADLAEANENFKPVFILSRPSDDWTGAKGYVQDFLEKFLKDFEGKDYYVCGVPQMVVAAQEKLQSKGVSEENIFTEGWEGGSVK
ncbi:MAG: FAD-dependent oxidoreductase [Candidatus Aenigmarchaeota archaeon]|nr:FAD-dependent oxidoreductase [Candidatus Aenigmarchaeota archaeon]